MTPILRVSLSGGRSAAVRALTGLEEADLRSAENIAGEAWISRALTNAVTVDGGQPEIEYVRSLSVGDRHALLLALIVASYGATVAWVTQCPACGEALDAHVNLNDLLARSASETAKVAAGSEAPAFRLPTGADLEEIESHTDTDAAAFALLRNCAQDAETLTPAAVAALEEAMATADPLADISLTSGCAACGIATTTPFDPASELAFRLASPAELLADVHALALSYGWTERDVMALPRPHRHQYLTLCADLS